MAAPANFGGCQRPIATAVPCDGWVPGGVSDRARWVDGRPARYQRDDCVHSDGSGWTEVAACSAVIIEAARCSRREQPEHLSFLIWIDTDREELLRPGSWPRRSNGGRVWNGREKCGGLTSRTDTDGPDHPVTRYLTHPLRPRWTPTAAAPGWALSSPVWCFSQSRWRAAARQRVVQRRHRVSPRPQLRP